MQVYRGLDVGTAKPSAAERAAVPHHLLDVAGPDETFSAARFVELADIAIAGCSTRQVPLIAAGGTPMYFRALFAGLFEGPPADEVVRARLRGQQPAELHARLAEVDPAAAARIHPADLKRMVRALEVFEISGRSISSQQLQWDQSQPPRWPAVWVGLQWEREALSRRINARVREMIVGGWAHEVAGLLERGITLSATAAGATGYRQMIEVARGRMTLDDAAEQIKIATRQLARRQMKWFRRFPGVHWLAGDAPVAENAARVMELWRAAGG
jgi:tRNA dimethylallyltransferase